jgi:hypothetical protein
MNNMTREKVYNVIYIPPDGVEVFVSVMKIVWGVTLLFLVDDYIKTNIFYFADNNVVRCVIGFLMLVDGFFKLWAWLRDKVDLRKWLAGVGLCFWIFVFINTFFSTLPRFTLIQFMVLIISDFWLYLRLGALRNDKLS